MGRKSKSAKSSINNLGSRAKRRHSVTIEEVEETNDSVYELGPVPKADPEHGNDGMSEEGFIFEGNDGSLILMGFLGDLEEESLPDFSSDSDSDEEDSEEGDYQEVNNLSDLEQFSNILVEAQRVAVEVENERLKDSNRPKHYSKNSARTKRRQNQIRKDLEKQGYFSVKDWFSKAKGDLLPQVDEEHAENDKNSDSDVEMIAVDSDNDFVVEKECDSASNYVHSAESNLVRFILEYGLVDQVKHY
jgi:hypothetical protein